MAMNIHPVTLEGEHVRLEPLTLGHIAQLSAVASDEELWRWTVSTVTTEAALRAYIEEALRRQEEGAALPFATVARATNLAVGSTRFGNIDPANRRLEIGWTWIGKPWQHTVVNTESKFLMLRYAFETLGCIRVEFKTDRLNAPSRAAILRIGGREEGTFRKHMITTSGRLRDTVYYSILDDEWPEVKKHLIEKLAER